MDKTMRNKDKIVAYVYETYDYDKFKKLEGNRRVLDRRKAKIKRSMEDVGQIMNPSIVNENLEIIDGQGRIETDQELGMPVHYIIVEGTGLKECVALNLGQTNWKPIDYVESYAARGNENYIRFLDLINQYPLIGLQIIYGVATNSINVGGAGTRVLKEGELRLSKEWAKAIIPALDFLDNLHEELKNVKGEQRILQTGLAWIINNTNCNVARLEKIITDKYPLIQPVVNKDYFLNNISDIYNKGLAAKNCMYFNTEYKQAIRAEVMPTFAEFDELIEEAANA